MGRFDARPGLHRQRDGQRRSGLRGRRARRGDWSVGFRGDEQHLRGNPLASAAVSAVVDIMRRERLEVNALRLGALMKSRLLEMQEKSPYVGEVRGMGLVMGVELVRDRKPRSPPRTSPEN